MYRNPHCCRVTSYKFVAQSGVELLIDITIFPHIEIDLLTRHEELTRVTMSFTNIRVQEKASSTNEVVSTRDKTAGGKRSSWSKMEHLHTLEDAAKHNVYILSIDMADVADTVIGSLRQRVLQTVSDHKGFVHRIVNNHMVVFFGIPYESSSDMHQACKSAVEISTKFQMILTERKLSSEQKIFIGILSKHVVVSDTNPMENFYSVPDDIVGEAIWFTDKAREYHVQVCFSLHFNDLLSLPHVHPTFHSVFNYELLMLDHRIRTCSQARGGGHGRAPYVPKHG